MSIYATYWEIKVPIWVACSAEEKEGTQWRDGESASNSPGQPVRERWIEVFAQAVPAHIGHPSTYDSPNFQDYYAEFLPPVVEYDPENWTKAWTPRAVFIIDEDHREKEGQRYLAPLLMLTGAEYEAVTFGELLKRIDSALDERFGTVGDSTIALGKG